VAIRTKLDGYRALAIKSSGKVSLRSRNDNDFNSRYPHSRTMGRHRRLCTFSYLTSWSFTVAMSWEIN
jgi:ATP-dependent DNA ligase